MFQPDAFSTFQTTRYPINPMTPKIPVPELLNFPAAPELEAAEASWVPDVSWGKVELAGMT